MHRLFSIETLRSLSTVFAFAAFIAICVWAYSKKRRDDFEQAANLPFADEHLHRPDDSDFSHDDNILSGEKNS